jgi:hypothetical protein
VRVGGQINKQLERREEQVQHTTVSLLLVYNTLFFVF